MMGVPTIPKARRTTPAVTAFLSMARRGSSLARLATCRSELSTYPRCYRNRLRSLRETKMRRCARLATPRVQVLHLCLELEGHRAARHDYVLPRHVEGAALRRGGHGRRDAERLGRGVDVRVDCAQAARERPAGDDQRHGCHERVQVEGELAHDTVLVREVGGHVRARREPTATDPDH